MERILTEENEWPQNVEEDLVEGPVEKVSQEEVVKAIGEMKAGKTAGPSEGCVEMIEVNGEIENGVMVALCQGVLDGRGMLGEWALSAVVPIFKGKGCNECGVYRGVNLLERRIRRMVKVDEMQFGFMPGKGTIDAVSF